MPNQELDKDECRAIRQRERTIDAEIARLQNQRQTASNELQQTRNRLTQEREKLEPLIVAQTMVDSASLVAPAGRPISGTISTTAALEISVIEARIQMLENEEEVILIDIENFDKQLSDMRSSREANAAEATRLNCGI